MKPDLTAEYLREWFAYDPASGVIFWRKKPRRNTRVGTAAGCARDFNGVRYIGVILKGRNILAHRIAFAVMTGRMPTGEIDHISGNGTDNRWSNLREVSHAENLRNQRMCRNNSSGCMGVSFHKKSAKWRARISFSEGELHLGLFDTKDEAIACRKAAEARFDFHANHGRAQ